jgi:hypothetical protein
MERRLETTMVKITDQESGEWARLIRKLRWIGMDEEAKRLEMAVSTLPADGRASVSFAPFSTD